MKGVYGSMDSLDVFVNSQILSCNYYFTELMDQNILVLIVTGKVLHFMHSVNLSKIPRGVCTYACRISRLQTPGISSILKQNSTAHASHECNANSNTRTRLLIMSSSHPLQGWLQ